MADNDAGGKILWLLGGAAIGVAVAMLYAPMSGEDARRRMAHQARHGHEKFTGSGREMLERGRELYERGRAIVDEAAEMFERGRKLMDEATPNETV